MSKPKITITISGPSGAGKSTLAHHLTSYLAIQRGLNVKLIDDNHEQPPPSAHNPMLNHFDADITITTGE